jgi:hypothetical protein
VERHSRFRFVVFQAKSALKGAGGSTIGWVGVGGAHPSKIATDEAAAAGVVQRLGQPANAITWHRQKRRWGTRADRRKSLATQWVSRSLECSGLVTEVRTKTLCMMGSKKPPGARAAFNFRSE